MLSTTKAKALKDKVDRLNRPLSAFGGGRSEIETEEEMLDSVKETLEKTTASLRHAPFRESQAPEVGDQRSEVARRRSAQAVLLHCGKMFPHPENRKIEEADCRELAESIREKGLLNPIRVRTVPADSRYYADVGPNHYQILAGERRWNACAFILNREMIPAVVEEEMSDAEALAILNIDNAQRSDLTAAEKARAIAKLHESETEGGGGLSWEAAGKIYGMSASGAQNLCAILKAPAVWLERMEEKDAEKIVHQATVREIAKFADHSFALKAIDDEFRRKHSWWPEERDRQVDRIADIVEGKCKRLDKEHYTRSVFGGVKLKYDAGDDATRKALGIVELPLGDKGELVECATNVKEFEKRLEKQAAETAKKRDAKNDKAAKQKAKERTPAEQKAIEKKQDDQLAGRIKEWRKQFLRLLASRAVNESDWRTEFLLYSLLTTLKSNGLGDETAKLLCEASGKKRDRDAIAAGVLDVLDLKNDHNPEKIRGDVLRWLLWPHKADAKKDDQLFSPAIPPEKMLKIGPPEYVYGANRNNETKNVAAIAEALGVTVAGGWKEAGEAKGDDDPRRAMVRVFFGLHNNRQLDALARSAGWSMLLAVSLPHANLKRSEKIDTLMGVLKTLRLPVCLGGSKPKAKGKG